ncbi:hypothetical protein K435DRAFT_801926 [Dendrothele bispora CBS 962.96]|uniref:Uncharacterized protein n=1 Tax=Dendrothele bispora (strain CBS 962.96) TaxID=1314807 RepID=A0A4S8LP45_DENBC|nr:hypothetical protein K435DRAFT_801926 [Dendrothele bispora CBS 962.96]
MPLETGDGAYSLNDQRIENYLHLIGFEYSAILLWDFILTFCEQMAICRYGSQTPMEVSEQFIDQAILLQSVPFFGRDIDRHSLSFFTLSFPFAYLTFRVYAIYNQNKKVFVFMALAGAVLAGLALTSYLNPAHEVPPVSLYADNRIDNAIQPPAITLGIEEAASWEALFVYDVLLFIMLVLRGVMALANLANIFTFYFAGPYTRGGLSTFSSA